MLAIPTWEQEYARPFLINGISILDELSDTIYAAEEKENRKVKTKDSHPTSITNLGDHSGIDLALFHPAVSPHSRLGYVKLSPHQDTMARI